MRLSIRRRDSGNTKNALRGPRCRRERRDATSWGTRFASVVPQAPTSCSTPFARRDLSSLSRLVYMFVFLAISPSPRPVLPLLSSLDFVWSLSNGRGIRELRSHATFILAITPLVLLLPAPRLLYLSMAQALLHMLSPSRITWSSRFALSTAHCPTFEYTHLANIAFGLPVD